MGAALWYRAVAVVFVVTGAALIGKACAHTYGWWGLGPAAFMSMAAGVGAGRWLGLAIAHRKAARDARPLR